ncbi:isochorismatase family protein [Paraburkholderia sp. BCC1886]|uniref:isochorismatase family protein n=1 Tax=Paraburkholderia sp. BCC1886 TaxID=2562670 RepID=UPI001182C79E|nr:isochorismatase family protein [Paraburkholderia sp. BCC1886]
MDNLSIDPKTTALVAIDLQHSNIARQLAPHAAADVVHRNAELAATLRAAGGTVIWVRVDVTALLSLPADKPLTRPAGSPPPGPQASELVPEIDRHSSDLIVTKRNWNAFYGTELDLLLRRRGIRTVLMSGVATNFGVESTARNAFDIGYELIFVEDAMSSISAEMHAFSNQSVFPHIGRVRSTVQVIDALHTAK